jgi:ketosteroid isomerase-like protein
MLASLWTGSAAATAAIYTRTARTINANVAEMVAGTNAYDVARDMQFDAPSIVTMKSGRVPSTGAEGNRQGIAMAMQYSPSWRLTMVYETVVVAGAGDMAICRVTYNEESNNDGVAMTHVVNFIADFIRQHDGF